LAETSVPGPIVGLVSLPAIGIQNIYGLENSDKCAGSFGQTYLRANGARANVRLYRRDFLIQLNSVGNQVLLLVGY
jgi:hypothetical protein